MWVEKLILDRNRDFIRADSAFKNSVDQNVGEDVRMTGRGVGIWEMGGSSWMLWEVDMGGVGMGALLGGRRPPSQN